MVYFLRPSYGMTQPSSPSTPSLDISSGNNLYMMIAVPLVLVAIFLAFVWMKRPTMLGLCNKDELDKNNKPKINTMRVVAGVFLVGLLGAGATYGGLMLANKSS